MNRERLTILRDHLASLPDERVDMRFVMTDGDSNLISSGPAREVLADCGTAACIAGWAGFLFSPDIGGYGSWEAGTDLAFTTDQAFHLFTPKGFLEQGRYTRQDAIAAIQSMLDSPDDDALPVWPEVSL
jgi:hypothetical protein